MFRYTIKELEEFSDEKMLACIIADRQEKTTNIYSPLNKRLNKLYGRLRRFSDTTDFLVGFQFVMELVRNNTSAKGNEIMLIEKMIRDKLKSNKEDRV
jgi:hypothetical protein